MSRRILARQLYLPGRPGQSSWIIASKGRLGRARLPMAVAEMRPPAAAAPGYRGWRSDVNGLDVDESHEYQLVIIFIHLFRGQ
jgi:hypothetical protein